MHVLREEVPVETEHEATPEEPHGRQAVPVFVLQQEVRLEAQLSDPRESPHGGKAVQVHSLR